MQSFGIIRGSVSIHNLDLALRCNKASDTINLSLCEVWLENFPNIKTNSDIYGNYEIKNVPLGNHNIVANLLMSNGECFKWRSETISVMDASVVTVP